MQAILQAIILCSIYIIVGFFKKKSEKAQTAGNDLNTIKMHQLYLGIGCTGSIITGILSVIFALINTIQLSLVLIIFSIVFSLLIFAYYGFRIYYNEDGIFYRYFYEKYKVIHYNQIVNIERGIDIVIISKTKKLRIYNYMAGGSKILDYINSRINVKLQKQLKRPTKVRKFKDSVERPYEFIIVYIISLILGMSFLTIIILNFSDIPSRYLLWLILVAVGPIIMVVLSVYSAKRAHSSRIWKKVAKILFKPGYLKK